MLLSEPPTGQRLFSPERARIGKGSLEKWLQSTFYRQLSYLMVQSPKQMSKNKKIYLSYKFAGEDKEKLVQTLGRIIKTLRSAGHTVQCSIEDEQWFLENKTTNKDILQHAFEQLDKSDMVLAFIKSNEKSEGMLLEIGYMMAKNKPLVLALKQGVKTGFLAESANQLIKFDSIDDLCDKLIEVNF